MTDLKPVDLREAYSYLYKVKEASVSDQIPSLDKFTTPEQWLTILKMAATPDKDFEQSFFQLAYDKLQEKLYNLLPFLIGFEIVNKSDDGTKALGVFAFRSNNNQVVYVPAFFIDGNVKGLDMLYSKNNEQFYPLNEDFAELFLKDDVTGLGDASYEKRDQINKDMAPTDLRNMVTPPKTGKISFASVIDYVKDGDNLTKQALAHFMEKNADFCESMLRFYDMEKIADALVPNKAPAPLEGPIRVVTLDNKVAGLSESQMEKLATDGVLLIDKRAEKEKSKIGLFQYTSTFTNPYKSGFYNYVTEDGTLRYGMVFLRPEQLYRAFATNSAFVVDLKTGTSHLVEATKLFIKDHIEVEDFSAVHKKLTELAEVEPSFDKYILVNENLKATQAFFVRSNSKDADGIRRIEVELDYGDPCRVFNDKHKNSYVGSERVRKFTLVPTKYQSNKLEHRGETIYVPKGYKLLHIKGDGPSDYSGRPGGLTAIDGKLRENGVFPFNLHSNGSEYFVSIGAARKKYRNGVLAKMGMVVHYGLDEKVAEDLIKSTTPGVAKKGYIKLAYTGEYTPYLRDENPYTNELGQPTFTGQGYEEVQTPTDGYQGDPTQLGKGVMPDIEGINGHIQQATQMAQNGQKGIFDTQAIATLAKYVSPHNKIFQYMPSFVKAMDELGRLLFLIYWETEKFEEMYGRSEVPELVELITNVFKNTGDLIIFLKRKSPELSINMVKEELSV